MAMYPCLSLPSLSFPSVSGAVCSFDSQYAGLPLKSHVVQLTAKQSGSGTPSPSNPRPISGYSAINISHSDADTSNPTVYTIQIGSTVYGGEYDAITGILTVTHKYFSITHVDYYGTYGVDNANLYYCTIPNYNTEVIEPLAKASDNGNITSNIFIQTTGSTVQSMANNEVRTTSANVPERFYFRADSFADVTDFNSYISNTPIQIVAKLTTPTTIQLPPCPIDTLEGVNNIFADCGDTTLQYIKLG